MTTKSANKKTAAKAAPPAAPSGINMLMDAISARSGASPSVPTNPALIAHMSDPALAGATRKGKSNVVVLGTDPGIVEDAREAARISDEIKNLTSLFSAKQATLRDYGAEKRKAYNKVYKTTVTTVNVPYTVEVPSDQEGDTPGRETRHVQVVCSNKYTVAEETVLAGRETSIGEEWFGKLFNTEKTKTLRPDAEGLFRKILTDNGILDENLEKAMELLFEEKTRVSTVEAYEAVEPEAPEAVRAFLAQSVTRYQPSLKFV